METLLHDGPAPVFDREHLAQYTSGDAALEAELFGLLKEQAERCLDAMQADLVGFSLSTEPGRACYVPVAHRAADGFDAKVGLDDLDPLAARHAHVLDGHTLAVHETGHRDLRGLDTRGRGEDPLAIRPRR